MSKRFYFDLTNGQSTIRDDKGIWVSNLDAAIKSARAMIQEIRESDELTEDEEGWLLLIKDAAGDTLVTLPVGSCASTPTMVC